MSDSTLQDRLRGKLLNCKCCARSEGECCCDTLWPEGACRQAADRLDEQDKRIAELERLNAVPLQDQFRSTTKGNQNENI